MKIAWRETRASTGRFVFVILAVAAGVAALSGVRGFSESFHTMLQRDARTFMAADLTVRGVSSFVVASWVIEHTPFDRLYFYGANRPFHVSVGPEDARVLWRFPASHLLHPQLQSKRKDI